MSSPGNLETVLRSGHQAQERRRRSPSPNSPQSSELEPDQCPTFTRPISPELHETKRYTEDPPRRKRTNPWSFRKGSSVSESGDDCDQPLSRRLSRKASTVLSRFSPQSIRSNDLGETKRELSKEPDHRLDSTANTQQVTTERRRSSLQKIKDLISRMRKDSANSEKTVLPIPPLDDSDYAMGLFDRLSPLQGPQPTSTADLEMFHMTGAMPLSAAHSSSSNTTDHNVDSRMQGKISEIPQQTPLDLFNERDYDATWIGSEIDMSGVPDALTTEADDSPSNQKRKRSRHYRSDAISSITSIRHKIPRHTSRKDPIRSSPGGPSTNPFDICSPLPTRFNSPANSPISVDDIGVLPIPSMESTSHITIPTFAMPSSTANSLTVPVPIPSLYQSPPSRLADQYLESPHFDPTVAANQFILSSGSSLALPAPSESEESPDIPMPAAMDWQFTYTRGMNLDEDRCPSPSATVADAARSHEELRLRRSGSLVEGPEILSLSKEYEDEDDFTVLEGLEGMCGREFARRAVGWRRDFEERDGSSASRGRARIGQR